MLDRRLERAAERMNDNPVLVDVDGLVGATDPDLVTEAEIEEAVARLEAAGSIDYPKSRQTFAITTPQNAHGVFDVMPPDAGMSKKMLRKL